MGNLWGLAQSPLGKKLAYHYDMIKNPITRRLNVVFRDFDMPQQTEASKAIRQAEDNYRLKGKEFQKRCYQAMDEEQIEKDHALLRKYGFAV